jgi:hypothetical protein
MKKNVLNIFEGISTATILSQKQNAALRSARFSMLQISDHNQAHQEIIIFLNP